MAYEKIWADQPKLSKVEKKKLKTDGLEIYDLIPEYAEKGFDAIPQEDWELFKWAGLYLQKPKEAGYFMMRVKVPTGILNYDQAVALAGISRDYGRGVFDVTTRQAVQFHWLTIDQMPDIFNRLNQAGLTSAGACGDIPRNIIGNPLAGIDPDEVIDTQGIVDELHHYFHMNPDFSNLPRKYKLSISANIHNAAHAEINCVAFIPAEKEIDGEKVTGFHIKVGGGLSTSPHLAQELDVFVRPEQVKSVAIAISTIFRDYGYRQKRTRARLKFLVADWGVDKFKEKLLEYIGDLPERGVSLTKEWNAGYFYGVHKQKQEGLCYVGLNVPVGRLQADEVFELARISKQYGNGEIRTCNSQNIVISNVPEENVEAMLKEKIFERITVDPPKFIGYSVSCTGMEYCNLAVTETKARMKNVAEYLDQHVNIDVPVRIHMNGCPNSCGQRQLGDIGLQGVKVRKANKEIVDGFEVYVGGTLDNGGTLNEKLKGRVEETKLSEVLQQLLTHFQDLKGAGEKFYQFVERVGTASLQDTLDKALEQA